MVACPIVTRGMWLRTPFPDGVPLDGGGSSTVDSQNTAVRMTRWLRACIVVAASLAFFVIVAPPLLETYSVAYTGVHRGPAARAPQQRIVVDTGSPAFLAGLRMGAAQAYVRVENLRLRTLVENPSERAYAGGHER